MLSVYIQLWPVDNRVQSQRDFKKFHPLRFRVAVATRTASREPPRSLVESEARNFSISSDQLDYKMLIQNIMRNYGVSIG